MNTHGIRWYTKILVAIILLFPILLFGQSGKYDSRNAYNKYSTEDATAAYSQQINSLELDSLQTSPDTLQYIAVFGTSNFDSCFIDTMRSGGSYVNMLSFALADTGTYNTYNYACPIDASGTETFYVRAILQDANAVQASATVASVVIITGIEYMVYDIAKYNVGVFK